MRKMTVGLLSLALVSGGGVIFSSSVANAAPQRGAATAVETAPLADELPNPLEEKRRANRKAALNQVLTGKAKAEKRGASTVVKVELRPGDDRGLHRAGAKKDQYVELSREKTDKIFVVLAEFGNQRHPLFPDQDTDPDTPGPAVFDGPRAQQDPGA